LSKWVLPSEVMTQQQMAQQMGLNTHVLKATRSFSGQHVLTHDRPTLEVSGGKKVWLRQQYVEAESVTTYRFGQTTQEVLATQPRAVHGIYVFNGAFVGDHLRFSESSVVNARGGHGPAR